MGDPALRTADFDFDLPPERIAQEPVPPRDAARLLVRSAGGDVARVLGVEDAQRIALQSAQAGGGKHLTVAFEIGHELVAVCGARLGTAQRVNLQ